jgi:uncharacterized membrane protein YdcZ (DUF606 family)
MGKVRPLRTLTAAGAAVAALIVLGFAAQDLLSYFRTVFEGAPYWIWAAGPQGIWLLTSGVAEAVTFIGLILLTIRLLSGSPIWKHRARRAEVLTSS